MMPEYPEMVKEAAEARIGADRMAMGLSCIPDELRGDMAEIERLNAALDACADYGDKQIAEVERLKAERDALQAEVRRLTSELYVDGIAPVEEPKP